MQLQLLSHAMREINKAHCNAAGEHSSESKRLGAFPLCCKAILWNVSAFKATLRMKQRGFGMTSLDWSRYSVWVSSAFPIERTLPSALEPDGAAVSAAVGKTGSTASHRQLRRGHCSRGPAKAKGHLAAVPHERRGATTGRSRMSVLTGRLHGMHATPALGIDWQPRPS